MYFPHYVQVIYLCLLLIICFRCFRQDWNIKNIKLESSKTENKVEKESDKLSLKVVVNNVNFFMQSQVTGNIDFHFLQFISLSINYCRIFCIAHEQS